MSAAEGSLPKETPPPYSWLASDSGDFLQGWYDDLVTLSSAPIHEVKLTAVEGGWLLMLKARSASRGALVCFYGGETVGDCVDKLHYDLTHRPGVRWKPDRFAGRPVPKDGDRR